MVSYPSTPVPQRRTRNSWGTSPLAVEFEDVEEGGWVYTALPRPAQAASSRLAALAARSVRRSLVSAISALSGKRPDATVSHPVLTRRRSSSKKNSTATTEQLRQRAEREAAAVGSAEEYERRFCRFIVERGGCTIYVHETDDPDDPPLRLFHASELLTDVARLTVPPSEAVSFEFRPGEPQPVHGQIGLGLVLNGDHDTMLRFIFAEAEQRDAWATWFAELVVQREAAEVLTGGDLASSAGGDSGGLWGVDQHGSTKRLKRPSLAPSDEEDSGSDGEPRRATSSSPPRRGRGPSTSPVSATSARQRSKTVDDAALREYTRRFLQSGIRSATTKGGGGGDVPGGGFVHVAEPGSSRRVPARLWGNARTGEMTLSFQRGASEHRSDGGVFGVLLPGGGGAGHSVGAEERRVVLDLAPAETLVVAPSPWQPDFLIVVPTPGHRGEDDEHTKVWEFRAATVDTRNHMVDYLARIKSRGGPAQPEHVSFPFRAPHGGSESDRERQQREEDHRHKWSVDASSSEAAATRPTDVIVGVRRTEDVMELRSPGGSAPVSSQPHRAVVVSVSPSAPSTPDPFDDGSDGSNGIDELLLATSLEDGGGMHVPPLLRDAMSLGRRPFQPSKSHTALVTLPYVDACCAPYLLGRSTRPRASLSSAPAQRRNQVTPPKRTKRDPGPSRGESRTKRRPALATGSLPSRASKR